MTGIYALFKKSFKKICNIHVQNEEGKGGVKGRLNNVKKTALFTNVGFPNYEIVFVQILRNICQGDPVYMKRGAKPMRREEPDHVFLRYSQNCLSFLC